ncbi:hypothetical protein YPC_1845 [Yersinia pestis biovar Medievalis str. Harbin 35]|nr:hypothetical protein YPC_1845 [Yersinia pestis biovar Medievalis str. Harbin 35]EEO77139.1 hypothetical protein YP516_1874 [Yersinia pestis Nepal516]EEO80648.1 hypothetical protein YPF_2718 [Yersinia pestis biovar Orientalis str. India 195]EEO84030.1 hypothetical protein YPH_4678 [Yersinia pestis biovar Orientalis str. PEXU2]EEO90017.1 hypothetical protein YPS_2679 [Yersinia pestis Pestoides A]
MMAINAGGNLNGTPCYLLPTQPLTGCDNKKIF